MMNHSNFCLLSDSSLNLQNELKGFRDLMTCKCMKCKRNSTAYCPNKIWECRLCTKYSNVMLIFQEIMPSAKYHKGGKSEFDDTKMEALN